MKKVIIIGAGPAGLFAARALKKQGYEPIILEKSAEIGGKCKTISDPDNHALKAELGAVVIAPNYGVVIDAISEKGIELEPLMKVNHGGIGLFDDMADMSLAGKAAFAAKLTAQTAHFSYDITRYKAARNNATELPEDFELPFAEYARLHGMAELAKVIKPLISGFGYGAIEEIPAYCVMEYLGLGTLPAFTADCLYKTNGMIISIKNGMQHLMNRLAEDFNVITSAQVNKIERGPNGVAVSYIAGSESKTIHADALVLAIPPHHWNSLGMTLTPVETACTEHVSSRPYAVAACKLSGLPAEQSYYPVGLDKQGFGHIALITTRDNRSNPEDGRLCTAYVNLSAEGNKHYSLEPGSPDRENLNADLMAIPTIEKASIVQTRIWEDYMPILPWQQRLELEKEQMRTDTRTVYAGAYPLGGFENVHCVGEQATKAVNHYFNPELQAESTLGYLTREIRRAFNFFTIPRSQAVGTKASPEESQRPAL